MPRQRNNRKGTKKRICKVCGNIFYSKKKKCMECLDDPSNVIEAYKPSTGEYYPTVITRNQEIHSRDKEWHKYHTTTKLVQLHKKVAKEVLGDVEIKGNLDIRKTAIRENRNDWDDSFYIGIDRKQRTMEEILEWFPESFKLTNSPTEDQLWLEDAKKHPFYLGNMPRLQPKFGDKVSILLPRRTKKGNTTLDMHPSDEDPNIDSQTWPESNNWVASVWDRKSQKKNVGIIVPWAFKEIEGWYHNCKNGIIYSTHKTTLDWKPSPPIDFPIDMQGRKYCVSQYTGKTYIYDHGVARDWTEKKTKTPDVVVKVKGEVIKYKGVWVKKGNGWTESHTISQEHQFNTSNQVPKVNDLRTLFDSRKHLAIAKDNGHLIVSSKKQRLLEYTAPKLDTSDMLEIKSTDYGEVDSTYWVSGNETWGLRKAHYSRLESPFYEEPEGKSELPPLLTRWSFWPYWWQEKPPLTPLNK